MYFHGHTVTIMRPATPEDQGFKPDIEQFLVRMENGEHAVAPADEVTEDPTVDEVMRPVALPKPKVKAKVERRTRRRKR